MQQKQVDKETKKANIRLATLLGIIALMGAISAFFMLGDKI